MTHFHTEQTLGDSLPHRAKNLATGRNESKASQNLKHVVPLQTIEDQTWDFIKIAHVPQSSNATKQKPTEYISLTPPCSTDATKIKRITPTNTSKRKLGVIQKTYPPRKLLEYDSYLLQEKNNHTIVKTDRKSPSNYERTFSDLCPKKQDMQQNNTLQMESFQPNGLFGQNMRKTHTRLGTQNESFSQNMLLSESRFEPQIAKLTQTSKDSFNYTTQSSKSIFKPKSTIFAQKDNESDISNIVSETSRILSNIISETSRIPQDKFILEEDKKSIYVNNIREEMTPMHVQILLKDFFRGKL